MEAYIEDIAIMENENYILDVKPDIYFEEINLQAPKKWCVVEFEDGLQVVPLQWITKGSLCHFPNYKSTLRYEKAVKNYELALASWPTYEIKILAIYDAYDEAKDKLIDTEDQPNMEEVSETRSGTKRGAECSEKDNSGKRRKSMTSSPSESFVESASPHTEETLQEELQDTLIKTSESLIYRVNTSNETSPKCLDNSDGETMRNTLNKILCEIKEIKLAQVAIGLKLSKFTTQPMTVEVTTKNDFSFPLKTMEDLESLEERCANSDECMNDLVRLLSLVGGETARHNINLILKKLLSRNLAIQYSSKGRKGKRNFSTLRLHHIIKEAVRIRYPSSTEMEITKYIGLTLATSSDWEQGRKLRASLKVANNSET